MQDTSAPPLAAPLGGPPHWPSGGRSRLFRWRSRRPWTLPDERIGFWFITSLDLQFLLGLILYVALSPLTRAAFQDFGAAMTTSSGSGPSSMSSEWFWRLRSRTSAVRVHKTGDDGRRHKLSLIFFTLALILILASIPWPTLPHGRPLLRW